MRAPWRRALRRMLIIVAAVYVLVLLLVAVSQRRLIYYPERLDQASAALLAPANGSVPWRNTAGQIIGWHWSAPSVSAGAVLVVHGNAGSAIDRDYLAAPIRDAAAIDVFVLEYPGYGLREGSPSQQSLLTAADDALGELAARRRIFVVGESLGTGVAAHLAGTHRGRVSGLALFAAYNNLAAVAQRHIPFLPMGIILRDRFDAAQWLTEYSGPVAVVLAGSDEIIAPDLGRRLYDGYAGPKQLQTIEGAHHNDIPAQPTAWWKDIFSFWDQHAQQ
jgi:pimeloyl-ACP methyl ester carboxylesterase